MKKYFLVLSVLALILSFLAGCATTYTKVERRNPKTGKIDTLLVIRDRGESPEKILAKGELLGVSAASELAADASLSEVGRLTAIALNKGAETTRAFARVLHETGVSSPTAPNSTAAARRDTTEVERQLYKAGLTYECVSGEWSWFYPPYDPSRLSPLSKEGAMIVYEKKGRPDEGDLIASIKAKYK